MMEMTGATKAPAQAAPVASAVSRHARFFVFHFCVEETGWFNVEVGVASAGSSVTFIMPKFQFQKPESCSVLQHKEQKQRQECLLQRTSFLLGTASSIDFPRGKGLVQAHCFSGELFVLEFALVEALMTVVRQLSAPVASLRKSEQSGFDGFRPSGATAQTSQSFTRRKHGALNPTSSCSRFKGIHRTVRST